MKRPPAEGRAVKFFPKQRQFRSRVFRTLSLCVSAALRETEYSLAEARRLRTQSSLIFKLPELPAGDCPEHGMNPAKAENLTALPAEGGKGDHVSC